MLAARDWSAENNCSYIDRLEIWARITHILSLMVAYERPTHGINHVCLLGLSYVWLIEGLCSWSDCLEILKLLYLMRFLEWLYSIIDGNWVKDIVVSAWLSDLSSILNFQAAALLLVIVSRNIILNIVRKCHANFIWTLSRLPKKKKESPNWSLAVWVELLPYHYTNTNFHE